MTIFEVTDPQSGVTLELEGDSPPTEQELIQIFNDAQGGGQAVVPEGQVDAPVQAESQPGFVDKVVGGLEVAGNIASSAVAEPAKGITELFMAPFVGSEGAQEIGEGVGEALTFQPRTQEGQENIETIGKVLEPIGKAFSKAESFLGDKVFEKTGSPTLAALATTFPALALEIAGFKGGKKLLKGKRSLKAGREAGKINKAIKEATPTIEQLKDASRGVFKEIDQLGATVKPKAYADLLKKINKATSNSGIDQIITPKSSQALNRLNEAAGKTLTTTELDTLRKVAQNAAGSIDPSDARIGVQMVDTIDSFLDAAGDNALNFPKKSPKNLGERYRFARQLWGRARRSEMIGRAFDKARRQASGFENGLRRQFSQILDSDKKSRFFSKAEKAVMEKVVLGGKKENLLKLVGKFGVSEGQAVQSLRPTAGAAGGFLVGGPTGAVAVPLIGNVSKQFAQKLTRGNAEFADQVIRAGKDAKKITKAYFANTSKANRSSAELAELLLTGDIDLSNVPSGKIMDEAVQIAKERRQALAAATAGVSQVNRGSEGEN